MLYLAKREVTSYLLVIIELKYLLLDLKAKLSMA